MESVSSNVTAPQPTSRPHSRTMRLDILPDAVSADVAPVRTRAATTRIGFHLTEQELQSLFQNGYDATLITDMAGSVLQGNHRAHEFLCANGRSLSGINVTTIISGADASLVSKLVQALETERYVRIHAWCSSGDGTFFPAEIAVYRSQAATSRHLCFFIRDITWRKEAEDRLQMVDTAMRTARAGIAMVDTEGVVTYANPAMNALCGIPAGQNLAGRKIADFFEEPEKMAAIAGDVAAGNTWGGQINLVHSSGQTIATDCDAAPTLDSDGDCVGAVLSFADISDTIRAQEAERTIERNRVMMESIGSVCHHLGQPSTVILNSLEMLQRLDESDVESRKELLQMSLEAAEQIGDLLRELNDLRTYRSEAYANTDSIVSIGAAPQEPAEGRVDDDGFVR